MITTLLLHRIRHFFGGGGGWGGGGTVNLFDLNENMRSRPFAWMVVAFYPVSGAETKWDERGGNSKSVRSIELMMECNNCLYQGWNDQTATTHIERWLDKSEMETHMSRICHIQASRKGTKCWALLEAVTPVLPVSI